jgi:hypothetical protein
MSGKSWLRQLGFTSLGLSGILFVNAHLVARSAVAQSSIPNLCPVNAGGGPVIVQFTTESYYIYICQGGTGRADWRELDYFAIPRDPEQADDWIRLRAYSTDDEFYAVNGEYRYEINSDYLTVLENDEEVFQEDVYACVGNPVFCSESDQF